MEKPELSASPGSSYREHRSRRGHGKIVPSTSLSFVEALLPVIVVLSIKAVPNVAMPPPTPTPLKPPVPWISQDSKPRRPALRAAGASGGLGARETSHETRRPGWPGWS